MKSLQELEGSEDRHAMEKGALDSKKNYDVRPRGNLDWMLLGRRPSGEVPPRRTCREALPPCRAASSSDLVVLQNPPWLHADEMIPSPGGRGQTCARRQQSSATTQRVGRRPGLLAFAFAFPL